MFIMPACCYCGVNTSLGTGWVRQTVVSYRSAYSVCVSMQAALDRPSYKATGPSDDTIIAGWSKFTGDFSGHVKQ